MQPGSAGKGKMMRQLLTASYRETMTRKKLFMIIESVLLALTAVILAAAAVRMYRSGAARQASGDIFYYIYTREKVAAVLARLVPLFAALFAFTLAGWVLGVRDEEAEKPAVLKGMDVKESVKRAVPQKAPKKMAAVRAVVLILAVILIILGVRNGGLGDVFAKGAAICTECVGLG